MLVNRLEMCRLFCYTYIKTKRKAEDNEKHEIIQCA